VNKYILWITNRHLATVPTIAPAIGSPSSVPAPVVVVFFFENNATSPAPLGCVCVVPVLFGAGITRIAAVEPSIPVDQAKFLGQLKCALNSKFRVLKQFEELDLGLDVVLPRNEPKCLGQLKRALNSK
jgi:hypothetical protein